MKTSSASSENDANDANDANIAFSRADSAAKAVS